jgi:parallel beta-helix repeat protein
MLILALTIVALITTTVVAQAATITVCPSGCDYTSIQSAINAAIPGDTIEVRSGTYYENVNVNKQLTLRGVDTDGGKPVVDAGGSGSAISAITLSADGCTLEGFNAINGTSYAGILITSNNNIITDNIANNNGGGIAINGGKHNNIKANIANNNTAGISLENSSNNIISSNKVSNNLLHGIIISTSLSYSCYNNIIKGNNVSNNGKAGYGGGIAVGGHWEYNNHLIFHNNLVNNVNNNAIEFHSTLNNQWDNGTIGNHYSNFDEPSEGCTDNDNNGICDSGYKIPGNGNGLDRFPLVSWSAPDICYGYPTTAFPGEGTELTVIVDLTEIAMNIGDPVQWYITKPGGEMITGESDTLKCCLAGGLYDTAFYDFPDYGMYTIKVEFPGYTAYAEWDVEVWGPTGAIIGEVTNPTDDPIENVDVYLYAAEDEYKVLDFIDEWRSYPTTSVPSYISTTKTDSTGNYQITEIIPGSYLVLAVPPVDLGYSPISSEVFSIEKDETEIIDLVLTPKYLNFDNLMGAIKTDSKNIVDDDTRAAAEVYVKELQLKYM